MRRRDGVIETEVKWTRIHLIHTFQCSVRVCSPADMCFSYHLDLRLFRAVISSTPSGSNKNLPTHYN